MGFNATWTKRTALGWFWLALIWTATTAKAQLLIDVYPSQDNDNQTIWIFSGNNSPFYGSSIRTGANNFHQRDSWKINIPGGDFYIVSKPTNSLFSLSPLFSSANNPKDIESVSLRIPGGGYSTSSFLASATNRADNDRRKRKQNHRQSFYERHRKFG